jgi:hypothetical protein
VTIKDNAALYAVGIYAALVMLGTVGELFGVSWINSLPIFRGP